jgi:hypothetical protein
MLEMQRYGAIGGWRENQAMGAVQARGNRLRNVWLRARRRGCPTGLRHAGVFRKDSVQRSQFVLTVVRGPTAVPRWHCLRSSGHADLRSFFFGWALPAADYQSALQRSSVKESNSISQARIRFFLLRLTRGRLPGWLRGRRVPGSFLCTGRCC